MTFVVKENVLPNPADVRFFGTFGVVEEADVFADAIEESGLGCGRKLRFLRIRGRHRPLTVRDRVPAIVSAELYVPAATRSTLAMVVARGGEYRAA
jgi:hypothetical protein